MGGDEDEDGGGDVDGDVDEDVDGDEDANEDEDEDEGKDAVGADKDEHNRNVKRREEMTNAEFTELTQVLSLEPGDKIALCFKAAPVMGDPQTGEIRWNYTAATYKGYSHGYLVVDTGQGREAIPLDVVMRFAKLSDIALAQPRIKVPS